VAQGHPAPKEPSIDVSDAAAAFFEDLAQRGHEPLLGTTSGTFRFEIENGKQTDRWLVSVDRGDITVSHDAGEAADCTVRAPREVFLRVASGELNALAAALRGAIVAEGDPRLLVRLQRLLPGPPPVTR
jgi:putative sterol carrier protein